MSLTIEHLESLDSLDTKRQELKDHKMWCIHFILTFDKKIEHGDSQQMFMQLIPKCNTDKEFMTYLFDTMSHNELVNLMKISTCMLYVNGESEMPDFLTKRGGKYYFNTDWNKDVDTRNNKTFLDNYLKKR